jgi:signal transduction histidine kinase
LDDRVIHHSFERLQRTLQLQGYVHFVVVDFKGNQVSPRQRPPADRKPPPPNLQSPPNVVPAAGPTAVPPGELPALEPLMTGLLRSLPIADDVETFTRSVNSFGEVYFVRVPVLFGDQRVGELLLGITTKDASQVHTDYLFLCSMLGGIVLLGWGTIYILTKRLIRPLEEVARIANVLKEGHYDVDCKIELEEKEVYEMMAAIQTMANKLKHLESLRTALFAGVTHELKTPIASVSGLLQAVKDNLVEGEERDEFLKQSIQETQRLQRMVEDLLDFNGFASGVLTVQLRRVKLHPFVNEVVHQWQMADEKHKRLDVSVENKGCPEYVTADTERSQQILINLLNNAFHAMKAGGSIQVVMYNHGDGYTGINVVDNGRGIPEEDRPNIFERFYRGSNKKYKVSGLGLGLPFSLMLARAQKGSLYLKRSSPEGTVFTLTLPLE